MKSRISILVILLCLSVVTLASSPVYAAKPVIHAVLFFSPSCPHCRLVMEQFLPPLTDKYKDQLDIVGIDVTNSLGQELYQAAVTTFNIPDDRLGVPTLIVGDIILVGSGEIPNELPGIIEKGLSSGGIDWPNIPGLSQVIAAQSPTLAEKPAENTGFTDQPAFVSRFAGDLVANHIAVFVLLGMIVSVIYVGFNFIKGTETSFVRWPNWVIPLLAIVGLGVASYLSYVEATQSVAICGPVGNCNSVQQSPYAHLFGIISIGTLGLVGYLAILLAWIFEQRGPQPWNRYASIAIWGMGWFGVLFSIYLTFLEPFVIGATCMWCITSAIIMTLILLSSTDAAKRALDIPETGVSTDDGDDGAEDEKEENERNPDA